MSKLSKSVRTLNAKHQRYDDSPEYVVRLVLNFDFHERKLRGMSKLLRNGKWFVIDVGKIFRVIRTFASLFGNIRSSHIRAVSMKFDTDTAITV